MDGAWGTLLAALIGAAAAIAGGAVAPLLGARSAREEWRRGKVAELCEYYNTVLKQAQDFLGDLIIERTVKPPDDVRSHEIFVELQNSISRLQLYASADLYDALHFTLGRFAASYSVIPKTQMYSFDESADVWREFEMAAFSAVKAIRAELGVAPLIARRGITSALHLKRDKTWPGRPKKPPAVAQPSESDRSQ